MRALLTNCTPNKRYDIKSTHRATKQRVQILRVHYYDWYYHYDKTTKPHLRILWNKIILEWIDFFKNWKETIVRMGNKIWKYEIIENWPNSLFLFIWLTNGKIKIFWIDESGGWRKITGVLKKVNMTIF